MAAPDEPGQVPKLTVSDINTFGDRVMKWLGWFNPYDDPAVPAIGMPAGRHYLDIFGINTDGTENKNDLYLRRYYIYRGKHRPHIYLHHIVRSDYERACHDHPWDFISFILKGGYTEICEYPETAFGAAQTTRKWKRPGTFIRHKATDFHRLELKAPAWSLVFSGKKTRIWGFNTPDKGWIAFNTLYQYIKDMMP